jgi:hypothetical protein
MPSFFTAVDEFMFTASTCLRASSVCVLEVLFKLKFELTRAALMKVKAVNLPTPERQYLVDPGSGL